MGKRELIDWVELDPIILKHYNEDGREKTKLLVDQKRGKPTALTTLSKRALILGVKVDIAAARKRAAQSRRVAMGITTDLDVVDSIIKEDYYEKGVDYCMRKADAPRSLIIQRAYKLQIKTKAVSPRKPKKISTGASVPRSVPRGEGFVKKQINKNLSTEQKLYTRHYAMDYGVNQQPTQERLDAGVIRRRIEDKEEAMLLGLSIEEYAEIVG